MAQIKKEFEEANLTHTRELEEANRTHRRELAEVREGWKKAKETHKREINEALSTIHQLQAQLKVVSHRIAPHLDWNDRNIALSLLHKES